MQLWQFILSLLVSSPSERVVEWTRERKYEFRILEPDKLAKLWGEVKRKPAMNFKKLARGLRYYYGKSMMEKSRGKQYTYEFVMNITTILGYDPVGEITEGRNWNGTKFSKPGTTPSTVFRSVEATVAGSGGQMEKSRGTTEESRGPGDAYCDTGEGFLAAFEATGEVLWGTDREFGETEEGNGFGETGEVFRGIEEGKGLKGSGEVFGEIKEGLESMKEEFRYMRGRILSTGEGFCDPGAGFLGIKLFDFSVLVESNDTSSFYEAL